MNKHPLIKIGFGTALITFAMSGFAATTADIDVQTTVDPACTISAEPLNFPKYNPISQADTLGSSKVLLTCVTGMQPTVTLSFGLNLAAQGGTERRMVNGTDFLPYEVYKAAGAAAGVDNPGTACTGSETVVWGADASSALHPPAAADANVKEYALCGKIKAGLAVKEGTYKDKLTATVVF